MAKKIFSIGEIATAKKQVQEIQKMNLVILDELKEIIPPLQSTEFEQLEANILAEGCREALSVWSDLSQERLVLIDGHNRYQICQKHQVHFDIKIFDFENIEAVKLWMYNNQLGRRNLSAEQAAYLRGKKYHAEKVDSGTRTDLVQNLHKVDTKEKLSQEYGVSARTIINDAQFAIGIDKIGEVNPQLKREILSGKQKVNKAQIQELARVEQLPSIENLADIAQLLEELKPRIEKRKTEKDTKTQQLIRLLQTRKMNEQQKQELKSLLEYFLEQFLNK